jgi:hypothetical protein
MKLNWTTKDKVLKWDGKKYPYKVWFKAKFDNQPCWYRIDNEAEELSALIHFNTKLKFAYGGFIYET